MVNHTYAIIHRFFKKKQQQQPFTRIPFFFFYKLINYFLSQNHTGNSAVLTAQNKNQGLPATLGHTYTEMTPENKAMQFVSLSIENVHGLVSV